MANHVTPMELARITGMDRGEILNACRRMSVPVVHGRIDKTLFLLNMRAAQQGGGQLQIG